jgi:Ca-activated chloride channel family protein
VVAVVAGHVTGIGLVSARLDDAMVMGDTPRRRGPGLAVQLLAVTAIALTALAWQARERGNFVSLWLTPDQQARRMYEALDFPGAYERFDDPAWKGVSAYDAGLYKDAAAAFGRVPTAVGFYNRGNALMKGREYRNAIAAYEQAVAEAPDWTEAQDNLALAKFTLDYIEESREQSDTGDESEYGADDYVFDNTQDRGVEIEITDASTIEQASAEKWMRSVNTETRDFLRSRFQLEAVREGLQ